jgi:hypothetical protein
MCASFKEIGNIDGKNNIKHLNTMCGQPAVP